MRFAHFVSILALFSLPVMAQQEPSARESLGSELTDALKSPSAKRTLAFCELTVYDGTVQANKKRQWTFTIEQLIANEGEVLIDAKGQGTNELFLVRNNAIQKYAVSILDPNNAYLLGQGRRDTEMTMAQYGSFPYLALHHTGIVARESKNKFIDMRLDRRVYLLDQPSASPVEVYTHPETNSLQRLVYNFNMKIGSGDARALGLSSSYFRCPMALFDFSQLGTKSEIIATLYAPVVTAQCTDRPWMRFYHIVTSESPLPTESQNYAHLEHLFDLRASGENFLILLPNPSQPRPPADFLAVLNNQNAILNLKTASTSTNDAGRASGARPAEGLATVAARQITSPRNLVLAGVVLLALSLAWRFLFSKHR